MQIHVKKCFSAIFFLLQNIILIKPNITAVLSCVLKPKTALQIGLWMFANKFI